MASQYAAFLLGAACLLRVPPSGATAGGASRALASVTTGAAQDRQTSIPYDPTIGRGQNAVPITDPALAETGAAWEQDSDQTYLQLQAQCDVEGGLRVDLTFHQASGVHLTYVNESSIVVSWATGASAVVNGPLQSNATGDGNPFGRFSTVKVTTEGAETFPVAYGTSEADLSRRAFGQISTYSQIYTGFKNRTGFRNNNPILNYTSPNIHHVQLTDLLANTTYFFKVTGAGGVASRAFNFTSAPGTGRYPLRLGVFADLGQTANSSTTLERMRLQRPDVATLIGDWAYADDHMTNGTATFGGYGNETAQQAASDLALRLPDTADRQALKPRKSIKSPWGSDQRRWDAWFRLAEPLLSQTPIIPNAGNHEIEPQGDGFYYRSAPWGLDDGRQFNSYLARVPVTPLSLQSGGAPLYFSTDVGPVHMIVLNNYEDFLRNGSQFKWLQKDLANVDRAKTPWVVAQWHAPWYSSYTSHYKQVESMRVAMEPLLYTAGVDIALAGHNHAYERTHAINNYRKDGCGIVHVTIGDGGNLEGVDPSFVDSPRGSSCPKPGRKSLAAYQPGPLTPSFVYDLRNRHKGYCPTSQPAWSAFRQPAFGHGLLTFINETTALWEWNRNLDSATDNPDSVYITRDRSCFNALGNGIGAAAGPAASPLLAPAGEGLPMPEGVPPGLAVAPLSEAPDMAWAPEVAAPDASAAPDGGAAGDA